MKVDFIDTFVTTLLIVKEENFTVKTKSEKCEGNFLSSFSFSSRQKLVSCFHIFASGLYHMIMQ